MTGQLVRVLIAHYDSVFYGPNGDYASVLEAVTGISAEQALWKPVPQQNSIWQIVEHLIASKEWQMDILEKGEASSPVWTNPSGDDAAWQATLEKLKDTHLRLKEVLAKLRDEDLLETPIPGDDQTLLELVLSSSPAHEAHHSGQIDYLKGLQSASD
jgi:uncharacterized damage-inducible protein DinB